MDREFYIPAEDQLASQSSVNRQGRGELLTGDEAARVLDLLRTDAQTSYDHYVEMLNEDIDGNIIEDGKDGFARELARMNLTLNTYTQWYWKIDLHNLMHFLSLRADDHAQYEIRVYADAMLESLKRWCPITYEAFMEYRVGGTNLSAKSLEVVKGQIRRSVGRSDRRRLRQSLSTR